MPQACLNIIAILYGLCFGSFANVVIYRLPRNESIIRPPSHCPACHRRLAVTDLIPIFSWLCLRGRCRYCGVRISIRYPVVEAVCAALFLCMTLYTGATLSAIPLCLFVFALLCISVIDWDTQTIPDGLLWFCAAVGVAWIGGATLYPAYFAAFAPLPLWPKALLGVVAGAAPLFIIDRLTLWLVKKDGFGFGDVKLMAVCGLFLGWQLVLVSFFFAFVAGGGYGAYLMASRRIERGAYIAFGPFLAAGTLAALWFGDGFIRLLLGF